MSSRRVTLDDNSPADRDRIVADPRVDRVLIGPYSRIIDRGALGGAISGRSREGRFLRAYEKMLVEHIGGRPSIVQRALIARASRIALHLELLDERVFAGGHALSQHDYAHYCAWSNSLGRMLERLSPAPIDPPATLADLIREGRGTMRVVA